MATCNERKGDRLPPWSIVSCMHQRSCQGCRMVVWELRELPMVDWGTAWPSFAYFLGKVVRFLFSWKLVGNPSSTCPNWVEDAEMASEEVQIGRCSVPSSCQCCDCRRWKLLWLSDVTAWRISSSSQAVWKTSATFNGACSKIWQGRDASCTLQDHRYQRYVHTHQQHADIDTKDIVSHSIRLLVPGDLQAVKASLTYN